MSDENSITAQIAARESSYRWITCKGCGGEVGIPWDWSEGTVECPSCDERIHIAGRVLYRPSTHPAPIVTPVPGPVQHSTSVEVLRKADSTLIFGLASIVLGWTILVPLIALCEYGETSKLANKERVTTPGKAIVGVVLALLFGTVQGLALVSSFVSK